FGNKGVLSSPNIDLTTARSAFLEFKHFLATENSLNFDNATVTVKNMSDGFGTETPILIKQDTGGAGVHESVDLFNFTGSVVKILLSFGTLASVFNRFCG